MLGLAEPKTQWLSSSDQPSIDKYRMKPMAVSWRQAHL